MEYGALHQGTLSISLREVGPSICGAAEGFGIARRPSISPGLKPVRSISNSNASNSCSSRARSSSSHSAHITERLAMRRNAFTCAGVHSSHRITGISTMPSLVAALRRRCPSTTSPSPRAAPGSSIRTRGSMRTCDRLRRHFCGDYERIRPADQSANFGFQGIVQAAFAKTCLTSISVEDPPRSATSARALRTDQLSTILGENAPKL